MVSRKIALNAVFWSAIENGALVAISFTSLLILARIITPSELGAFSISLAIYEIANVVGCRLFHDALIQKKTVSKYHYDAAFTLSFGLSLVIYAMLFFAFPFIARSLHLESISVLGRVTAIALLIDAPASILNAQQSRAFGFRILAIRTFWARLSGGVLGIAAALLGFGVWSLVAQYLAISAFSFVALLVFAERKPRLTLFCRPALDLLHYGSQATLLLFTNYISKRVFVYFSGQTLGAEAAGFISIAFRVTETLWSISATAISQVLLPSFSRLRMDRDRLIRAYEQGLKLAAVVVFPAFMGLASMSNEIIDLLFGAKWRPAASLIVILGVSIFAQLPKLVMTSLMSAEGLLRPLFVTNVVVLGLIVLVFFVAPPHSVFDAVMIFVASETISSLATFVISQRCMHVPIRQNFAILLGPLVSSTLMGVLIAQAWILTGASATVPRMFYSIILGAAVYFIFMVIVDIKTMKSLRHNMSVLLSAER